MKVVALCPELTPTIVARNSSERGFPVTAPLSVRTPAVAPYFYGHYNLGT